MSVRRGITPGRFRELAEHCQATLLHLFGIDHERFSVDLQGLPAKLTGVDPPAS